MTLVHVVVEDEFTEDDGIVFSDLDYVQVLQDEADSLTRSLEGMDKPLAHNQYAVYPDTITSTEKTFFKKMAVSCLQVFVAVNWFGCDYDEKLVKASEVLQSHFPDPRSYLQLTDESFYGLKNLELLAFAKYVLYKTTGASVWKARYLIIHQIVLSVPSTNLYLELKRVHQQFEGFLTDESKSRNGRLLRIRIGVELSQFFLWYTDVGSSKPLIDAVRDFAGLRISFTGALGKRTRFQEKETAQLCCRIERTVNDTMAGDLAPADDNNESTKGGNVGEEERKLVQHPTNVSLNDDTLLNQVVFTTGNHVSDICPNNQPSVKKLQAEEEMLLFAIACQIRRLSSFCSEGNEELITLIEYLISTCSSWCIRYECLLMRSLAEKQNVRRADRSIMQLNHLVDEVHQTLKFDLNQNLHSLYSVILTPKWIVQKYLADVLFDTGCIKSALDVYSQVRGWKEMISCYHKLDRKDKAEALVREKMDVDGESPYLLYLLGNATQDPDHYEKSWSLSDEKYFQSKTALGDYYFEHKDYKSAIPHYQASQKLNGLQISTWQRLGYAALTVEDYELAVRAYRRFVEFEPDVFEAWNNLSKAYIKLDRKMAAYSTLQEALKCNYEEWRLWENYLIVSTDVGSFDEVIRSWHRLIEIRGKHEDDGIIEILVSTVMQDMRDMNGNTGSRLAGKLLSLFARIKGTPYSSPVLWLSYARLLLHQEKEPFLILDAVRRCNRSISQSGCWVKDESSVRQGLSILNDSTSILCTACSSLPAAPDASPDRESVAACKLMIESMMKSAMKAVSNWDPAKCDVKRVNELIHELDEKLPRLPVK